MNEVKDRVGFLREGLFAKYVVALVGLVVFVLAVNGAIETWITYRGIKSSLNDGMSEKAEATAKPTTPNCCGRCRRSASSRCSMPKAANSSA